MATKPKPRVPFPQYDYPGSKISPFTGKPYTAQQATKVHQASAAKSKAAADAAAKKKAADEKAAKLRKVVESGTPNQLIKESRNRFNTVDSTLANNLATEVFDGRMTMEQAIEAVRQGKAVSDPNKLRVGLDVSAEIDPQIAAIERRRKLAQETLDRTVQQDTEMATRTNKDIEGIYAALMNRLSANQGQISQQHQQTSGAINSQYAALQEQMAKVYADTQAQSQAAVAGAGGAPTAGMQGMATDHNAFANIAGIQNQGIQGILAVGAQGEQNINRGQVALSGFEGANAQVEILRALQERAAALKAEYGAEDYELGGQASDLESTRYPKLYEGYQTLQEQQDAAMRDAEDRAYEREMAERALGVKEYQAETQRYGIDAQTARENARLRQEAVVAANKHNIEVQRLKLEQQKLTDPLQRQLIQSKIDSEQAKATKAMAEAKKATQTVGKDGKPDKYSQAMSVIANIPGARPDQVNYLQGLVDSAAARSDYDKFFITKGNEFMMERLNKDGYTDDVTRRYVRQALAILLGVV